MSEPSTLLLEHHLKVLKLPTFLRDYKAVAAVCAQERSDYPTFLLRLAERELIDREQRAAERRIRDARFPVLKTLESFDFAAQPSINAALVRELVAHGEYILKKENVLLVGNPGTGKTHLATALGFAACGQGKKVRFATTTALVTELLEARESRALARLQKQLERLDLLILDELGYVPFSKTGAELLFDVISRAYERTSLIVTTNLPFENWTEVLGSERLTGAMLDRLTHRVHILEANGESYRLKDAKKRASNARRTRPHSRLPEPTIAPNRSPASATLQPPNTSEKQPPPLDPRTLNPLTTQRVLHFSTGTRCTFGPPFTTRRPMLPSVLGSPGKWATAGSKLGRRVASRLWPAGAKPGANPSWRWRRPSKWSTRSLRDRRPRDTRRTYGRCGFSRGCVDPQTDRRALSSRPRLACAWRAGLQLPAAGAAGHRA